MNSMLLSIIMILGCAIALAIGFFMLQKYLFPDLSLMQERLIRIKEIHDENAIDDEEAAMEFEVAQWFKGSGFSNDAIGQFLSKFDYVKMMRRKLIQASIRMPADRFILFAQVAPVVFFLILGIFIPQVLILAVTIPFITYFVVNFKANKRMNRLVIQLPSALNLMTTALRAGHSFQSATNLVMVEMTDPIATEFSMLVSDANLGIPVKTSLSKLVDNLGLPDIRMFAVSVIIQRESGGNLAEVMDKLGTTIRARQQLKGQISALTAQSRMTGYVLALAPVVLLILLTLFFYDYVALLYEELLGQIALVLSGIMMLIGFLIIRKIVDIRL